MVSSDKTTARMSFVTVTTTTAAVGVIDFTTDTHHMLAKNYQSKIQCPGISDCSCWGSPSVAPYESVVIYLVEGKTHAPDLGRSTDSLHPNLSFFGPSCYSRLGICVHCQSSLFEFCLFFCLNCFLTFSYCGHWHHPCQLIDWQIYLLQET